mmetsp:Transcript_39626/g.112375  ORF Transcript_39626/g.112375 Transcript_39626/m.112375 type:complete len:380 (-) Transcript_39626:375-1514(-)
MRRCGSDPDLYQPQASASSSSKGSNSIAKTSPVARWRWAFQMVKFLTKGCSASMGASVMLLPEHWLEASHPEHRSHMKPYFDIWRNSETQQSFFYWLDKGEGRHIDLPQRPRAEMESRRVRYCGPELALLEVIVEDGLLKYRIGHRIVHTPMEDLHDSEALCSPFGSSATSCQPGEARPKSKWIYVLDLDNRMYINKKQAGEFHHSSFTRGGPVRAAGSIIVHHGTVKQITAWSGHYRPTEEDFKEVIHFLESQGVDMSQAEKFLTKNKSGSKMRKPRDKSHVAGSSAGPCSPDFSLRRMSAPSLQAYHGSANGANGNVTVRAAQRKSGLSRIESASDDDGNSSIGGHPPPEGSGRGSDSRPAASIPHLQHFRASHVVQ